MMIRCITFILATLPATSPFSFGLPRVQVQPNPALQKYTGEEKQSSFKIKIIIGDEENRMPINGLLIKLNDEDITKKNHISMPGADGPFPHISTGARPIDVIQAGGFVSLSGLQKVKLIDGCWEMGWREEHPAGALVCGFNHPESNKHNGASFPSGRIYISFPLWTKDTLAKSLTHKKRVKDVAEKHLKDKLNEIDEMNKTNNPLMKALHYRNAFAAAEKVMNSRAHIVEQQVPEESDMISIKDDLLLCTKGTVWTKKDGFFGGDHVLLGYATVQPAIEPSLAP